MSIAAQAWVFEHSRHKGAMLSLHQAIADGAQDDGTNCLATLGTLGWKARLAESHTRRCLRKLESAGDITIQRGAGPNGLNIYHLTFQNPRPPRDLANDPPEHLELPDIFSHHPQSPLHQYTPPTPPPPPPPGTFSLPDDYQPQRTTKRGVKGGFQMELFSGFDAPSGVESRPSGANDTPCGVESRPSGVNGTPLAYGNRPHSSTSVAESRPAIVSPSPSLHTMDSNKERENENKDSRAREIQRPVPQWWTDMLKALPKWGEEWTWEKCEQWLDENGFDQDEGAMAAESLMGYAGRDKYEYPHHTWCKWVRQDSQKRKDNIAAIAKVNQEAREKDPRVRFARRGVEHGYMLCKTPEDVAAYYYEGLVHTYGKEGADAQVARYLASNPIIA